MSAVTLSTVKTELKTIGCKLKSQLDGSWAICEPKGSRVIVPTLEDVNLYYLAKTGKTQPEKAHIANQSVEVPFTAGASLKTRVEESRSKPNPFMDNPVEIPAKIHEAVNTLQNKIENPVKQPVVKVNVPEVPQAQVSTKEISSPQSVVDSHQRDLRLSTLKVELKSLGCQLKSQLDGSWAICEPKGARVIVPTLEAVKEYYLSNTGSNIAQPQSPVPEKHTKPLTAAALANLLPETEAIKEGSLPEATIRAVPVSAPSESQISEQQKMALAAVNNFINDMKEKRLAYGLNFLHSEIKPNLLKHGCPEALMEKAYNYAEAKLYKHCMDKMFIKRTFENHLQKNDVMYFDGKYAHLFSGNS